MGVAVNTIGATVRDVNQGYAQAQVGATQDIQRLGITVKALSFGSDSTSQALMALQAQANRNTAQGIKNQDDVMNQFNEISNRRREIAVSEVAAVVGAQKAFQDFSQSVMNVVMPIIGNFATKLMSFVADNLPDIQQGFEKLAVYVEDFSKNVFSKEGQDKIINDIQYYFGLMMIELKRATLGRIGLYSEESAKRDKALFDQEKAVYDSKAALKRLEMENARSQAALEYKNNVDGKKEKIDAKLKEDVILEKDIEQNLVRNKNLTNAERFAEQQKLDSIKKRILQNQELIAISKGEGLEKKIEKVTQDKENLTATGKIANENLAVAKQEKEQVESKKSVNSTIGAASGAITGAAIGSVIPGLGTIVGGVLGGLAGYAYGALKEPEKISEENSLPQLSDMGINMMAAGGIVKSPSLAMIAEKASPEAVVPLESAKLETFFAPVFENLQSRLVPLINNLVVKTSEIIPKVVEQTKTEAAASARSTETLYNELQILNRQTTEMIRYLKDTADYARRNVDATNSLSGDFFRA